MFKHLYPCIANPHAMLMTVCSLQNSGVITMPPSSSLFVQAWNNIPFCIISTANAKPPWLTANQSRYWQSKNKTASPCNLAHSKPYTAPGYNYIRGKERLSTNRLPLYTTPMLTLPMLRLFLSKAQECKEFWKPSEPCHIGTLAKYS